MKKRTAMYIKVVSALTAFLLLSGCALPYKKGVKYKDYPDRDVPVYDDAVVFHYDSDDDNCIIRYGTNDDVEDVQEFYQDEFDDDDYQIIDEEIDDDEYYVEGTIDDIYFEIEVEEASGKESKYFDTVVKVYTEKDKDSEKFANNNQKPVSGMITPEALTVGNNQLRISLNAYDVDGELNVDIQPVKNPTLPEITDGKASVYDFKIEGKSEFDSLIELEIPYDADYIESGQSPEDCVNAMYFNEEASVWEPVVFALNQEKGTVVITTDHLSKYAAFTFKNSHTRKAYAEISTFAFMTFKNPDVPYTDIINAMIENSGEPPKDITTEAGFNIANEALGITGNAHTFLTEAIYAGDMLTTLGNAFTALGVTAAIAQAAYDWNKDDGGLALKTNLTKNISYLAVGKWGSSAAKLCSVGVFAIDYSLNAFGTEAWSATEEKYKNAYKKYMADKHPQLEKELYKAIYASYKRNKDAPAGFNLNKETETIVMKFCSEFWQDDANIAEYLDCSFGGGGGLNKKLINKLIKNEYIWLMQTTMRPVLSQLNKKILWNLKDEYIRALKDVRDVLNTKINVRIFEKDENDTSTEYKYAKHLVKFHPLNEDTDYKKWAGRLKENSEASTHFTLLGYLQSGMPNTLQVYEPNADIETDKHILEIPFTLKKDIDIKLGMDFPTLDDLSGTWDDANKNYLSITEFSIPMEEILAEVEEGLAEAYGCEAETVNENYNKLEQIKNVPYGCTFVIEKIDDANGTLTILSVAESGDMNCDNTTGNTVPFTYDSSSGTGAFDGYAFTHAYLRKASQNNGEAYNQAKINQGLTVKECPLTARFVKADDGSTDLILDISISYIIDMSKLEADININENAKISYIIHGER